MRAWRNYEANQEESDLATLQLMTSVNQKPKKVTIQTRQNSMLDQKEESEETVVNIEENKQVLITNRLKL